MSEAGDGTLVETRGLLSSSMKMTVPASQLRWFSPLLTALVYSKGGCNETKEQKQPSAN